MAPPAEPSRFSREGSSFGPGPFRWLWEGIRPVLVALFLLLLVRGLFVEAFKIPTGSMEETLLVGDFLLVNKAAYGAELPGMDVSILPAADPQRGDVVIFNPPHDPKKHYVKRVVGVPGDTLQMARKELRVNGRDKTEPYVTHLDPSGDAVHPDMRWQERYLVTPSDSTYRPTRDTWGPLVVPHGRYFVLGDSRDNSEDSRYWGFVEREAVRGRPLFIYYSVAMDERSAMGWVREIRWARIGGRIR